MKWQLVIFAKLLGNKLKTYLEIKFFRSYSINQIGMFFVYILLLCSDLFGVKIIYKV